jgi:hypothetical protein
MIPKAISRVTHDWLSDVLSVNILKSYCNSDQLVYRAHERYLSRCLRRVILR